MVVRRLALALSAVLMVVAFQNCSLSSEHDTGAMATDTIVAGKGCDAYLMQAFKNLYYQPWFTSGDANHNCLPCHAAGGEAGPQRSFANADINLAFSAFAALGRSRVEANGQNAGHKPPHTGPQNSDIVSSAQATWNAAEAAASACNGGTELFTVAKKAPANVYTTTPADTATTPWPMLSWDLDSDIVGATNQVHMTASVEIRRFLDRSQNPPVAIGYQFRNPTVRIKGTNPGATYRIQSISMKINGQAYAYMTAYELLDATVSGTSSFNLAQGSAFAAAPTPTLTAVAADEFQLRFGSIVDGAGSPPMPNPMPNPMPTPTPNPNPVTATFASLQSNDPTVGVFRNRCNSCHNAANKSGNLDITSYTAAKAVASTIKSRVNNGNNPMPPSGLLSANERALISAWVDNGTPQN